MATGGQAHAFPDHQPQLALGSGFQRIGEVLCLVVDGDPLLVSYLAGSDIDRDILLSALSGLSLNDPILLEVLSSYPKISGYLYAEA